MNKRPVSVIIPAFNQELYLRRTILSAVGQSIQPEAIIVVDDGSSDRTLEIAQQLSREHSLIRVIARTNGGASAARNTGLMCATTEYILFLDADDCLHKDAIEKHLKAFAEVPHSSMVFGSNRVIDAFDQCIGENIQSPRILGLEQVARRAPPCPSQCLYRNEVLCSISGYDETIRGAEDLELNIRASRFGPIYCHGELVMDYRHHPNQATKKNGLNSYRGRIFGIEKHFGKSGVSPNLNLLREERNRLQIAYSKGKCRSLLGAIWHGRLGEILPLTQLCLIGSWGRCMRLLSPSLRQKKR